MGILLESTRENRPSFLSKACGGRDESVKTVQRGSEVTRCHKLCDSGSEQPRNSTKSLLVVTQTDGGEVKGTSSLLLHLTMTQAAVHGLGLLRDSRTHFFPFSFFINDSGDSAENHVCSLPRIIIVEVHALRAYWLRPMRHASTLISPPGCGLQRWAVGISHQSTTRSFYFHILTASSIFAQNPAFCLVS